MALVNALQEPHGTQPMGKTPIDDGECLVPRVAFDPEGHARLRRTLVAAAPGLASAQRLILVNPNASKLISIRKWPIDNYVDLVRALLRDEGVYVGITGVASERDDADYIIRRVCSEQVVDFTGNSTLEELVRLYDMADLLVTNDSGPAHFASLSDIPIVFFGPETPALYGPLSPNCTVVYSHLACSPCVSAFNQRLSPCTDNRCLQAMGVDQVQATVQAILAVAGHRWAASQRPVHIDSRNG